MTQDLTNLQLTDFKKYITTDFHIFIEDEEQNKATYSLKLVQAVGVGSKERDITAHGRESFSLIFTNDDTKQYLIQQTYELHHEELGILYVFLVPIGLVDDKMCYEVIFT